MNRTVSEHWLGLAAGMAFLAIGLACLSVLFGSTWQSNYVGSLDELFAGYPQTEPVYPALELAPLPLAQPVAEVAAAVEVAPDPEVAHEYGFATPLPPDDLPGDFENQATAVVENPYSFHQAEPPSIVELIGPLVLILAFPMLCGAVAARVGPSVVPWRGAVAMAAGITVIIVALGEFPMPAVAISPIIASALGYAGGGLVNVLTRARLRAA